MFDLMQASSASSDGGSTDLSIGQSLRLFEAPHDPTLEQQQPSDTHLHFKVFNIRPAARPVLLLWGTFTSPISSQLISSGT